jgi:hypothetical protein
MPLDTDSYKVTQYCTTSPRHITDQMVARLKKQLAMLLEIQLLQIRYVGTLMIIAYVR